MKCWEEVQKLDLMIGALLENSQHRDFMKTYGVLIQDLRL
jgi:hypothetical protein